MHMHLWRPRLDTPIAYAMGWYLNVEGINYVELDVLEAEGLIYQSRRINYFILDGGEYSDDKLVGLIQADLQRLGTVHRIGSTQFDVPQSNCCIVDQMEVTWAVHRKKSEAPGEPVVEIHVPHFPGPICHGSRLNHIPMAGRDILTLMREDMSHVWTEPDWDWLDTIALEHNWVRFIAALDRELWMTKTLEEREAAFRQACILRDLGKAQ